MLIFIIDDLNNVCLKIYRIDKDRSDKLERSLKKLMEEYREENFIFTDFFFGGVLCEFASRASASRKKHRAESVLPTVNS